MGLGELDTIAVRSSMRRRGVGGALMAIAVEDLAVDGYLSAIVWTLANYPHGDAFYRATGWTPDGASRAGGTQFRYRRSLR
jgi:GNAT superfamily N-acetyltransferase